MRKTRILAEMAIFVALGSVLHAAEALIPIPYVVPGAKLGLANTVALYVVLSGSLTQALATSFLRTLLGGFLSGTFLGTGYYLSTAGALVSTLVMWATNRAGKGRFSEVGVSVAGAVAHNVAQLAVASFLLGTRGIFFYLPYLLAFAIPTGIFVGLLVRRVRRAIPEGRIRP